MAIDFPASPTVGQQYIYNGVIYTFTAQGTWATGVGALSSAGFRANKNNVDQGSIGTAAVKITFATEEYDRGNCYDAPNSRWTPPAGIVHLDAVGFFPTVAASNFIYLFIYKNGAPLKRGTHATSFSNDGVWISVDDVASGTDYYEVYAAVSAGSSNIISGTPQYSYFNGHLVGGPPGADGAPGPTGATGGTTGTAPYQNITTSTTISATHQGKTLGVDATSGNITLTLSAASSYPVDFFFRVVRLDNTANTITFAGPAIDGRSSSRLVSQFDAATIRCTGSIFFTEEARWRKRIVVYGTVGANTFTVANEVPLGCTSYQVEGWGGGGGGGGSSGSQRTGGGAGGSYGRKIIPSNLDTTLTCTVAGGGAGGGYDGSNIYAGGTGGATTIVGTNLGTLSTGNSTGADTSTQGGVPGALSGPWDETLPGDDGSVGTGWTGGCGAGGGSPRGAGPGQYNVSAYGHIPGGGGAGGNHAGGPGGNGAAGRVTISIF
jgi:hypothetical protein